MKLFNVVDAIATETIDHQYNNDVFKNELIGAVQSILDKIDNDIYKNTEEASANCPEHEKIRNTIFKRTGILVKFLPIVGFELLAYRNNAAVRPLRVNLVHALDNLNLKKLLSRGLQTEHYDYITKEIKPTIDTLSKTKGTVDTKTGRLGGSYSAIENDILVDFHGLYKSVKMSAPEIAAVIMHEIGHVFTWSQFTNKMVVVNQALQHIYTSKQTMDSDKLYKVAYEQLTAIDKELTEQEIRNMISGNTISVTYSYYLFFKKNLGLDALVLDLNGHNSNSSSETIADTYSVRMGFALESLSAMDKMNKNVNRVRLYLNSILCAIMVATVICAFIIPGVSATAIATMLVMFVMSGLVEVEGDIYREKEGLVYKYDKERLQKIYNQSVDSIKQLGLAGVDKQAAVESLKSMKQIIDSLPSDVTTLNRISHILSSKARVGRAYGIQQDTLEKIASNELFVKAIELELLSKGKKA